MMCKDAKKGKGDDLFLFFDEEGNPQDVKAYHVNEYIQDASGEKFTACLLYTSPSPRDATLSRMPSSA